MSTARSSTGSWRRVGFTATTAAPSALRCRRRPCLSRSVAPGDLPAVRGLRIGQPDVGCLHNTSLSSPTPAPHFAVSCPSTRACIVWPRSSRPPQNSDMPVQCRHVLARLDVVAIAQISTADDALAYWEDVIPEDVGELRKVLGAKNEQHGSGRCLTPSAETWRESATRETWSSTSALVAESPLACAST